MKQFEGQQKINLGFNHLIFSNVDYSIVIKNLDYNEDSCSRDHRFESRPHCRDHLSCTINLDQKYES